VTRDYWYDPLGRLSCVTTTAGTAASCNSGATVSPAVVTANSYDFMDRFTATHSYSAGTLTSKASYSYDALDRTAQETENHPAASLNRTTTFSYEGLTNLSTKEVQANSGATTSTDTKTYDYDTYGHRISLNDSTVSGTTTTTSAFTYGYDVHGDVSMLVNQANGSVKASYGYTPYGAADTTLSKGDTAVSTPFNPYRYTAKRLDSGSQTYDMGTRRFDPSSQRFLQLDQFQGALTDLALASDPLTQNRYDLGASNPLSGVEYDGHMLVADGGGGATPAPQPVSQKTPPSGGICYYCHAPTPPTYTSPPGSHPAAPRQASTAPGSVLGPDCNGFTFKLGACPSERGAAGTTAQQVKQSFFGAALVLTSAIPVGDLLDAALGTRAAAQAAGSATRVFWTGGDAAKSAATKFATENGGTTIGMTREGQALEAATQDMPWSKAQPLWNAASERFGAGASGDVHVFINLARANPESIWANTELPALVDNPNVGDVIFHLLGR
jgi:RHS repeat-associated protein